MHVYETVRIWRVQEWPDALPGLYCFMSIDNIILVKVDQALLNQSKLDGSAT
jgi:hypothetical protein